MKTEHLTIGLDDGGYLTLTKTPYTEGDRGGTCYLIERFDRDERTVKHEPRLVRVPEGCLLVLDEKTAVGKTKKEK